MKAMFASLRAALFFYISTFTMAQSGECSGEAAPQQNGWVEQTVSLQQLLAPLKEQLSAGANISYDPSTLPRWSDYEAPKPGAIINVAVEEDVAIAVSSLPLLLPYAPLGKAWHQSIAAVSIHPYVPTSNHTK
jgi:hypothetical protein